MRKGNMAYLSELESFFNYIKNNSARSLDRNQLIENFLQYMSKEYGHNEDYFRKQFDENSTAKDFGEFIYKDYMGLTRDLRREYENVETEAKDRIKLYKKNVRELHDKVESIAPSEKYTRGKYIFFLSINEKLLQKAKEGREKEAVFKKALGNCREQLKWLGGICFYDNAFSDIQQYDHIDWKSKINFLEASIRESDEFTKIKQSDHEEYLALFKNYIDQYDVLERILYSVLNNYYLQNRQEIIKEAVNLFVNENYIAFVYLLVPQIEGLFDVYKTVLGINDDKEANGLIEKLEMINKHQRLWGYIYYAFEFPVLRNDIAHGKMVNVTSEIAYDTLMDVFYLFNEIESSDREYKKILEFLETFKKLDDASTYVLGCFSDSINRNENLEWLKKCLDGNYANMLAGYDHLDTFNRLKEFFESNKFRISIYNYEPIEIKDTFELKGTQYSRIKINRELEKHIPLLNLLENHIQFPSKWVSDVRQRISEIKNQVDENKQVINRLKSRKGIPKSEHA